MPRAVLVIQNRPSSPDREQEYLHWYHAIHIPEVLEVPGIVSGRLFRVSEAQMNDKPPDPSMRRYLTIYEIDSDEISGVFHEMVRRRSNGIFQMSDAIEMDPAPVSVCYEVLEDESY